MGTTQTTGPEPPHRLGTGVAVAVAVAVGPGVAEVGVGVEVAAEGVLVGVAGAAVAVAPGVGEATGVGQAVVPLTVTLPPWVLVAIGELNGSPRTTRVRSSELLAAQEVASVTVASTPLPIGPGVPPS